MDLDFTKPLSNPNSLTVTPYKSSNISATNCRANAAQLTHDCRTVVARPPRDVTARQLIYARHTDDYCQLMNTPLIYGGQRFAGMICVTSFE